MRAYRIVIYPSAVFLALVNLVPLIGVLFWGWDLLVVFAAYALEAAVLPLVFIPKVMMAEGKREPRFKPVFKKDSAAIIAIMSLSAFAVMWLYVIFALREPVYVFANAIRTALPAVVLLLLSHVASIFLNRDEIEQHFPED